MRTGYMTVIPHAEDSRAELSRIALQEVHARLRWLAEHAGDVLAQAKQDGYLNSQNIQMLELIVDQCYNLDKLVKVVFASPDGHDQLLAEAEDSTALADEDDELVVRVRRALRAHNRTRELADQLTITNINGMIILEGRVNDLIAAESLVAIVSSIDGVRDVYDQTVSVAFKTLHAR